MDISNIIFTLGNGILNFLDIISISPSGAPGTKLGNKIRVKPNPTVRILLPKKRYLINRFSGMWRELKIKVILETKNPKAKENKNWRNNSFSILKLLLKHICKIIKIIKKIVVNIPKSIWVRWLKIKGR